MTPTMTPTDAARYVVEYDNQGFTGTYTRKATVSIARALLDAEERERSAIEIINRILPYAIMPDDVREEVESAILKIIETLEATGKAGG